MNVAVPSKVAAAVNVNDPSGFSTSVPSDASGGVTRAAVRAVVAALPGTSFASTPGAGALSTRAVPIENASGFAVGGVAAVTISDTGTGPVAVTPSLAK